MSFRNILAVGAAAASLASVFGANEAFAQSTASQAQEVIVTGTRTPPSTAGLATRVNEAKDEAIVGQKFIQTQLPSANIGQLINFIPGISNSTEDPTGCTRSHGSAGRRC